MARINKLPYRDTSHGTFEDEWGYHKKISEWWYSTGYFTDEEEKMYSFQFTIVKAHIAVLNPFIIMLALTDFESGEHYYFQKAQATAKNFYLDDRTVGYGDTIKVVKRKTGMIFTGRHNDFSLDLELDYGKGAFWNCDNGVLKMGTGDTRETTFYFSYSNMPTTGTMTLEGTKHTVTGKSWFDRQGGPFHLLKGETHWEWFSLRFFDDEEMMLFSFPQNNYQDGTFISKDSEARRLNDYTIKPLEFIDVDGIKFSSGWEITVPGLKEEHYLVHPIIDGQMNLGYFELLAEVLNDSNERVGFCFVELLPGPYNEKFKVVLFKSTV
ncbi:MAG: carotenoid 1,2-hydratase [Actinobacteria bacterium]|nr:carotenoid 1,2-hydratase [Actinomycetota bacterium]